jgi:hypothetical protein
VSPSRAASETAWPRLAGGGEAAQQCRLAAAGFAGQEDEDAAAGTECDGERVPQCREVIGALQ